jgi:small subunit ribosomal protein S21
MYINSRKSWKDDSIKMEKTKKRGKSVTLKEGENISSALRRLKRKVDESGLMEELRERESYIKPTTRRKKSAGAAKARWKKKLREQELPPKLY